METLDLKGEGDTFDNVSSVHCAHLAQVKIQRYRVTPSSRKPPLIKLIFLVFNVSLNTNIAPQLSGSERDPAPLCTNVGRSQLWWRIVDFSVEREYNRTMALSQDSKYVPDNVIG